MHLLSRFVATAGAGLAVAVLAGCGGNGSLLSSSQASKLGGYLTQAKTALSDDDCKTASSALSNFNNSVEGLSGVNATLLSNLQQGVQTTERLATTECPVSDTTTPSTTTPTASTAPTTKPARTRPSTTTTKTSTHPKTTTTATQPQTGTTPTEPSVTTTTTAPASPTTTSSGGGGLTPTGTPGAE